MQKQNEERTKALLMGSREEQMQATILARFQQQRGNKHFTPEDFMFLDQKTRKTIETFDPTAAPDGLNTPIQTVNNEIGENKAMLQSLTDAVKAITEAARARNINPEADAATYAGTPTPATTGKPPVPEIAVNVGGVHIDIGDQFARITGQFGRVVAQQIQPQLDSMSSRIAMLEHPVNNQAHK